MRAKKKKHPIEKIEKDIEKFATQGVNIATILKIIPGLSSQTFYSCNEYQEAAQRGHQTFLYISTALGQAAAQELIDKKKLGETMDIQEKRLVIDVQQRILDRQERQELNERKFAVAREERAYKRDYDKWERNLREREFALREKEAKLREMLLNRAEQENVKFIATCEPMTEEEERIYGLDRFAEECNISDAQDADAGLQGVNKPDPS